MLTLPQSKQDILPGRLYRSARKVQELRLHQVAAAVGISESALSLMERGLRPIPPAVHAKLLAVLFNSSSRRS